jgi:hypothetical protein
VGLELEKLALWRQLSRGWRAQKLCAVCTLPLCEELSSKTNERGTYAVPWYSSPRRRNSKLPFASTTVSADKNLAPPRFAAPFYRSLPRLKFRCGACEFQDLSLQKTSFRKFPYGRWRMRGLLRFWGIYLLAGAPSNQSSTSSWTHQYLCLPSLLRLPLR